MGGKINNETVGNKLGKGIFKNRNTLLALLLVLFCKK